MLKIVLIALLLNAETGEVKSIMHPAPAYETMEQCREAQLKLPSPPDGYKIKSYCIDPSTLYI